MSYMNYEERLEVAKRLYELSNTEQKTALEYIFPELAMSEDEKIRKELKHYLEERRCQTQSDEEYINCNKFLNWLEKQRTSYTKRDVDNAFVEGMAFARDELEKQGEQKPVDNVGSKFKVEEGKWYVCTQTFVLRGKIVIIKGQTYQAEKDNVIKGENGCRFIDRHDGKASDYFRSWTIQDAKDGDVLINWNNTAFIFKTIEDETVKFHVAYNEKWGTIKTPLTKLHHLGLSRPPFEFRPATKEQRDLLFQKMEEAGYEWNSETKKLNDCYRINNNNEMIAACIGMCLTDANEQRFKDYNTNLKECLAWVKNQCEHKKFRDSIQVGDEVTRNSDGVIVNLSQLKRVAKKDEKQGEQKPTDEDMKEALRTEYEKGRADAFAQMQKEWSEEDEKIKEDILYDLNTLLRTRIKNTERS